MSWVRIETRAAFWRARLDRVLGRRWVQIMLFFAVLCLAWLCSPRVAHAQTPAHSWPIASQA